MVTAVTVAVVTVVAVGVAMAVSAAAAMTMTVVAERVQWRWQPLQEVKNDGNWMYGGQNLSSCAGSKTPLIISPGS